MFGLDPATHGKQIRARLGVVPQADQLDTELTVAENLVIYGRYFDIPRAECKRRAAELLEFVQLTERATSKVEPLSGGMKRRVTIARSLINEPELLLLDEPTTGLDPQARHVLWDRLYRLKQQGVTLVLTTHYMDEAEQLCDRLVVMDGGRIVAEGSPRQLIEQHSTREVLELRFAAGTNEAAAPAIEGIGDRVEVLPDRILVYAHDGEKALAMVHDRGVAPESALVRRSSLEDVFLRLTGRTLVDMSAIDVSTPAAVRVWGSSFAAVPADLALQPARQPAPAAAVPARDGRRRRRPRRQRPDRRRRPRRRRLRLVPRPGAAGDDGDDRRHPGGDVAGDGRLHVGLRVPGDGGDAAARPRHRPRRRPVARHPRVRSPPAAWRSCWRCSRRPGRGGSCRPCRSPCSRGWPSPGRSRRGRRRGASGDQSFPAIMRFGIVPMFLFAGAFYPITQLPGWLQAVARLTPLYHGVELCRGAVLHTLGVADGLRPRRRAAGVLGRRHGAQHAARSPGGWRSEPAMTITVPDVAAHLRIIPPALLHARRPQRMIERSIMVNRRTWLIIVSGFFEPLFYLLSIRVGFGDLVGDVTVDGGRSRTPSSSPRR